MLINQEQTVGDLQTAFQAQFPYLKLAFYRFAHVAGEGSPAQTVLSENVRLAEVSKLSISSEINIDPSLSVAAFEALFREKYGLHVQVFRKSGNLWMQTTATDHWTLAEQNRKGDSSETQYIDKYGH